MRSWGWSILLATAVLAGWLLTATPRARAGRVACDEIIAKIIHQTGVERGKAVDLSKIAKGLHTTTPWVEQCMRAAGRRPKRPGLESAESREEELEQFEDEEPEENLAEDKSEPGAREREVHPERQRRFHIQPTPTPEAWNSGLQFPAVR